MLKDYLKELKEKENVEIEVSKKTIYCFDNEPFRFIIAQKQGLEFEGDELEHSRNSWNRSKQELERMVDYIAALSPHMIKDSVTLNNARRVVVALCQPLADISSQIQINLQELEKKKDEVMTLDVNRVNIESHLVTRRLETRMIPMNHPTVVCKSTSCMKLKNIHGIINRVYEDLRCDNKWKEKVIKGKAKTQSFRLHKNRLCNKKCSACGCLYMLHEEITEFPVMIWTTYKDPNLERALQDTTKKQDQRKIYCEHVDKQINYLTAERQLILKVAAQFATFLKVNL